MARMSESFPGYYAPVKSDFDALWKNGTVTLDANVLLNLYRYPETAREEILNVFERLSERIWVPYQAALEFQRNRPTVIAEQKRRFREVRDVAGTTVSTLKKRIDDLQLKKRHSIIDPDNYVAEIGAATDKFLTELDRLEESQIDVNENDRLRQRIDAVIGNGVGSPPENQEEVEKIYKQGEERFRAEMPPGFLDSHKGDKESNLYSYGGVIYQKKYGDLMIWFQIIDFANKSSLDSLILITDDEKSDWWWTIDSSGRRKLGPRPELIEEMKRSTTLENFYIYSTEQFVSFSREYLETEVSDESIKQIREVSSTARPSVGSSAEKIPSDDLGRTIAQWLSGEFPLASTFAVGKSFPWFEVSDMESGRHIGVHVSELNIESEVLKMSRVLLNRSENLLRTPRFDSVILIFVFEDVDLVKKMTHYILSCFSGKDPAINIILGTITIDFDDLEEVFEPIRRF